MLHRKICLCCNFIHKDLKDSNISQTKRFSCLERFLLLMILLFTLLAFHYKTSKRRFQNTPPGPLSNYIPFVGFLPFLDANQPEQSLTNLSRKYGKIYSLQMGSIFTVILTDVTLIREALKQDELSGRAPLRVTHGIFFGHGKSSSAQKF